jgi:hypothetical protein
VTVGVDETGHDDCVGGVDRFGIAGPETFSDLGDPPVLDEDVSLAQVG